MCMRATSIFGITIEVDVLGGRAFACEAFTAFTCDVHVHICMGRPRKREFSKDPLCMNVILGCRKAGYATDTKFMKIEVDQRVNLNCEDLCSDSLNWM